MPTAPTITKPDAQAPALPLVPFVRASFQHVEPANVDRSNAISASSVLLGPDDVPAYGYLRHLVILVTASAGTGSAAVYKEDAPFSIIQEITLHDVNGAPIVGPLSGYDLYLINKYGGYAGFSDPKSSPSYTVPTTGNFGFILRVPVELSSRDGLGSLPNMNASATYKVRIVQAAKSDVFSTDPTGLPTIRFRVWAECWAAPGATSAAGAPQAVQPPAIGTTQMWSKYVVSASAGFNTLQFRRVGSPIRNLILVGRNVSDGLRSDTNLVDPIAVYLDSKLLTNEAQALRKHYMRERLVGQTNGPDTGVLVLDYTSDFDGLYGGEMRDQWLQTIQSTRLELQGSFVAAQTLTVLTNDVAVVGNPFIG
jgi:hypothetical protein